MIEFQDAIRKIEETVRTLETTTVPLISAPGRTLAADIRADIDSPPYDKSMMDGFAVRSEDISSGIRTFKIVETIGAGDVPTKAVLPGTCSRIMTGAPVPGGADCVVIIEWTNVDDNDGQSKMTCEISDGANVGPGRHIIRQGENISNGQTVFRAGHTIRPTEVGLLAEIGAHEVDVYQLPDVEVVPTGNELVHCSQAPGPSQIRNSNGPMLHALLDAEGCKAISNSGIVGDDRRALREAVNIGLTRDLMILTGGVSMGEFDLVPEILRDAGVVQVFHKVKMKPGKPVWFGCREKDGHRCYVFGLPGNPVSSLVGFLLLVRRTIGIMKGNIDHATRCRTAVLADDHHARGDRPTFWPACWLREPANAVRKVKPLAWKGSSDMSPLTEAEALICFPAGTMLHEAGKTVEVIEI